MKNNLFKKYLKAINYRITESSPFQWNCYGENAHFFTCDYDKITLSAIVDLKNQTVYEMELMTETSDTRWIHPDYKKSYQKEAKSRGIKWNQAWDDVDFQEVDDVNKLLKKMKKTVENAI